MEVAKQLMNEKELRDLLENSSPQDLRVVNYVVFIQKKHCCSTSTITHCTSCKFSGCKDCYMKHVKERHPTTLGFLERTATTNLISWQQPEEKKGEKTSPSIRATSKGRVKCPCDGKFRSDALHHAHMLKKHKGQKCRKRQVAASLQDVINSLSLEEIEKLLAASLQLAQLTERSSKG